MVAPLEQYENNWETRMGAWFPGETVVLRGKDVFNELSNSRWVENLIYAVIGEHLPKLARLLEAIWVMSTSYPDPRLWNNRISSLGATCRSTGVLGVAASAAASEATVFGLQPIKSALDFLYRLANDMDGGSEMEDFILRELKKHRGVPGFGRPVVDHDERIEPVLEFAKSMGMADGFYTDLALKVGNFLAQSRYKYQINIAGLTAGLAADQGITPEQWYFINTLCFCGGFLPCFIDAYDKPEGSFFPLRTDVIRYVGTQHKRSWE